MILLILFAVIQIIIEIMSSNQHELECSAEQFHKNEKRLSGPSELLQITQPFKINQNGFTYPPTPYQVIPVMYAIMMSVETVGVVFFMQNKVMEISFGVVYSILFGVVAVMWYITTKIDPTDSIQKVHRESEANNEAIESSYFKFYCHICKTCVSKNSFHCRSCNRCVDCFDHHCRWLNNCVGAKNYFEFLTLIFSTEIFITFHIMINLVDIVEGRKQMEAIVWLFYIEVLFVVMDLILLGFNSALVGMHLYLVIKKKTTLEIIMEKRKISKIHPSEKPNLKLKNERVSQLLEIKDTPTSCNTKFKNESQKFKSGKLQPIHPKPNLQIRQ